MRRRTFVVGTAFLPWATAACGDDGSAGDAGGSSETGTTTATTGPTTTSTGPDGTGTSGDGTGTDTGMPGTCDDGATQIAWDPDAVAQDDVNFPLAIMAGEMLPESFMVAIYVEDAQPRTLRVWRPSDDDGMVWLVREEMVTPSADGYLKFTVDGLCPGTWYRYGLFTGPADAFTQRSILGEVRTAIAEDAVETLVIAMSACNGNSFDWPALDVTADEYYDMFLHLGDMAYNDGMVSLQEYRDNWKLYLGAQDMQRAYSRSGLYATWDDHEITDNSDFDPRTMDPAELQRRQNAWDAYFELLPIDAEGPNYRLWRSFKWGLTAEIIVLDCRYERRPSNDIYISQEQMDFLKDRLLNSPCHFKIVMNSVPITNMPPIWDLAIGDRWEGFPAQRQEVLDHISDNDIRNVWMLSGDFHVNFVSRLEPMGNDRASITREIACTGGNVNPVPAGLLGLDQNPFDYGVNDPRGVILTFDPEADAVNVRMIDPTTGQDDYNETLSQP